MVPESLIETGTHDAREDTMDGRSVREKKRRKTARIREREPRNQKTDKSGRKKKDKSGLPTRERHAVEWDACARERERERTLVIFAVVPFPDL